MSAAAMTVEQRTDADCLRAAVASLLGVPYDLLPDVNHESEDWIGDLNADLRDWGWPFQLMTAAAYDAPEGRWIAVVPSLTQPAPIKHAVVMDGRRLLHDPGRKATYSSVEPEDVKCAVVVVVTGPGWGPHRDPAWQPKELTA